MPAAYTSHVLLSALDHYPAVFRGLDLAIPESGNALPDLLDEALWNLRWMLTMQDADGGLYHKLTHPAFSGMVMPSAATAPRYVVAKSTGATLAFAAAAAQAARLLGPYAAERPGLADSARTAALRAWAWARRHPDVPYAQDRLNAQFEPAITTGAYADDAFADEFAWAAAELALATGQDSFLQVVDRSELFEAPVPYWETSTGQLGQRALAFADAPVAAPYRDEARAALLALADRQLALQAASAYRTPANEAGDFVWGGTALVAAKAALLADAAHLTGRADYAAAAVHATDYLLGRNPTAYSFVTGLGDRTPLRPHHRPSEADAVEAPVPGLLVGGPSSAFLDDCPSYPSDAVALRYVDDVCSYTSNEVTTYWNAPFTYAAGAIEAFFASDGP